MTRKRQACVFHTSVRTLSTSFRNVEIRTDAFGVKRAVCAGHWCVEAVVNEDAKGICETCRNRNRVRRDFVAVQDNPLMSDAVRKLGRMTATLRCIAPL